MYGKYDGREDTLAGAGADEGEKARSSWNFHTCPTGARGGTVIEGGVGKGNIVYSIYQGDSIVLNKAHVFVPS